MFWACHTPQQPLQNHSSGHLGRWATLWSAEEMLDGQYLPITTASCIKDWKSVCAESSIMSHLWLGWSRHWTENLTLSCPMSTVEEGRPSTAAGGIEHSDNMIAKLSNWWSWPVLMEEDVQSETVILQDVVFFLLLAYPSLDQASWHMLSSLAEDMYC